MRAAKRVPRGYWKIGDDVAVIRGGRGRVVLKVDMLVEETDVPPGMNHRQAARKAVAMCVSDFAAKGVRPDSFMVSLGLRRGTSQAKAAMLARGFRDAQDEWGLNMVGGDTNEAGQLVIDCAMVGFAKRVVGRSGARPGDVAVATGSFGYPPSGLAIMAAGAKAEREFRARALKTVVRPTPQLDVGLALSRYLTSSMDSSDGLARSLHTLAAESGVGFDLDQLPVARGVAEFAEMNSLSMRDLVLAGGEEYVIVGTVGARSLRAAAKAASAAGGELIQIGHVTSEVGEVHLREGGSVTRVADKGWTHLA